MNAKKKLCTFLLSAVVGLNLFIPSIAKTAEAPVKEQAKASAVSYCQVAPLQLVQQPQSYMYQNIKIVGTFDKFSTLGLDYKPAFRDSKKYISFLLRRSDVPNDYVIPLSELKLLIKRDKVEKMKDLESGDKVELTGNVFSTALNDPWVDVKTFKILSSKKKIKKADKEGNI